MDDNKSKDIVPKKRNIGLSKASNLAKRGLEAAQKPSSVQYSSSLSQF